ncbi:TonB-dependent receptor domain-containing protein [Endozoicomonas sp. SCSIO W0465]|uniref:TonB-dependent receptor domain-containing protein n=1 Tax=Endozoicomonas sp. SCSIO W0465 TaxID=2918516 RepID=UPI002076090D|nr:TonB-dependent receptor [Endozoicomonas sp. SCSIO W0465]USE35753.1 TonB-dependent receptor [Endozoicomonas sp. SCSIO W0465]USE38663.1 TonB-dependent receptor [Endozoicomonas sp. SCSIO W0465]
MLPTINGNLALAGRFDDYNDDSKTGSAFTPKASFAYRPADVLLVRGGVGKSFRAPDMQRLFGGTSKGFLITTDRTS